MHANDPWPMQWFDPEAEVAVFERRLPHWAQAGTVCFITFRTHDSMPARVLERWFEERERWLRDHGISPAAANWRTALEQLDRKTALAFRELFWNRWHDGLDAGHGACVLRDGEVSQLVADSLGHFDGQRYCMFDYVVMPNHVHVLCSFPDEGAMLAQCHSWKHYTARQINGRLGQTGRFWQPDAFDHLVRSEAHFEFLRRYIGANPKRAQLGAREFRHYSKLP